MKNSKIVTKLLPKILGVSVVASAAIIPLTQCSCSNGNDSWGDGYDDLIPGEQGENKPFISSKKGIKFEKGKTYKAKFNFSSMPEFVKNQTEEDAEVMSLYFLKNTNFPPEKESIYLVEKDKDICKATVGDKSIDVTFEHHGEDPIVIEMPWSKDYATKTFVLTFTPAKDFAPAYFVLVGDK